MTKDRQKDRQKKAGSPSVEGSADPTVCQQCFREYEPPSDPRKDDGYCCDDCEQLHDQQLLGDDGSDDRDGDRARYDGGD